ncbi:hypothetical protein AArc1_0445 [Natrarchaeobaculum sulfurireducens]|uniref:Uncharacterized protein n=1 Tax=Natrarchaeobaculum sulfurireducens TaxID=2044521 RepID=A0A346PB94_9EURY|nr:hypothetical protein AArc1_0445 [Natrarchaeobaculum sulfurireducens]
MRIATDDADDRLDRRHEHTDLLIRTADSSTLGHGRSVLSPVDRSSDCRSVSHGFCGSAQYGLSNDLEGL